MRTITVEVTAEDIRQGERNSPDTCPIALALRRVSDLAPFEVPVHEGFIEILDGDIEVGTRLLPPEAARFIRQFDRGDSTDSPLQPFTFHMDVPLPAPME